MLNNVYIGVNNSWPFLLHILPHLHFLLLIMHGRDLALTSSCLHLFIVANKTENRIRERNLNPGPLARMSTPLALRYAHLTSREMQKYASLSYCAIRTAIAPAHLSPGPDLYCT